jgi:hypothetical protein
LNKGLLHDGAMGEDWVSECWLGRENIFASREQSGGGEDGEKARIGLLERGDDAEGWYWGVSKGLKIVGWGIMANIVRVDRG